MQSVSAAPKKKFNYFSELSALSAVVCVCVADSDMLERQPPKSHVGLLRDDHNPQRVRPMESSEFRMQTNHKPPKIRIAPALLID